MNLKKYLQEQAEKDAEALLTEADRIFCMQLARQVVEDEKLKKEMNLKNKKRKKDGK